MLGQCLVIDLDSIIGRSSTRFGFVRDQSGIADTSYINPIALPVIMAPEFTGILANAIDGRRFNYGLLRTIDAGELGPNTAIEEGQNTLLNFSSRAISNTFKRPCIFRFQASEGFFSPVADKIAASK